MPTPILMPALSPTMTEGNLARWLKKEGEAVRSGDVIAEIETDKATMEVEAVDEGVLGKILVPAGSEGVKVNTPIALLLGEERLADVEALAHDLVVVEEGAEVDDGQLLGRLDVAAHEVAHLRHMNHGPSFWRLLFSHCPDARRARDWLKTNGAGLHRYRIAA